MARVLLVDDDAAALDLRKVILEREGHQISIASDPCVARALFAETQPECVVLDLRLPEAKDGLELIRMFRDAAPDIRIIVLAGWPPDLEGTPEAQMVNLVLAKPIRTAQLVSALAESEPGRP
ncbi:MAG: response regulator [Acidobacteriota bacterium]